MKFIATAGIICALTSCGSLVDKPSSIKPPTKTQLIPKAHPGQYTYYKIKHGDTLYSIAWRHDQNYESLAHYNSLKFPYTIYPGQYLIIPRFKRDAKVAIHVRKRTPKTNRLRSKTAPIVYAKPSPVKNWQWPVNGDLVSHYKANVHKGIKIRAKPGEKVKAAAAGKVVYSGSGIRAYGNLVIIKHNKHFLSAYGYNRRLLVRDGEQVRRGQEIAVLGHDALLHFEIRNDGDPVNPLKLLKK